MAETIVTSLAGLDPTQVDWGTAWCARAGVLPEAIRWRVRDGQVEPLLDLAGLRAILAHWGVQVISLQWPRMKHGAPERLIYNFKLPSPGPEIGLGGYVLGAAHASREETEPLACASLVQLVLAHHGIRVEMRSPPVTDLANAAPAPDEPLIALRPTPVTIPVITPPAEPLVPQAALIPAARKQLGPGSDARRISVTQAELDRIIHRFRLYPLGNLPSSKLSLVGTYRQRRGQIIALLMQSTGAESYSNDARAVQHRVAVKLRRVGALIGAFGGNPWDDGQVAHYLQRGLELLGEGHLQSVAADP